MPLSTLWLLASDAHGGLLTPAQGLVFWATISFSIVMIVLKSFAWGPISTALDERAQKIRDGLNAAELAKKEAEQIASQHAGELERHRKDAEQILEEARSDAKGIIDRAGKEATKAAEETKLRALREIDLAREKAIDDLRQSAVDMSVALASKVLAAEVEAGRHRGLIDDFLRDWDRN
jgi:F-type H+-transporting ATPase subunit b